jgi:flagellin
MSISIRTNSAAANALTNLNKNSRVLQRTYNHLSTGLRISRASDDAAGLGMAENLHAASRSATVAGRNTNDGLSMIAVAEGAADQTAAMLTRMRELAVQGSSGTMGSTERAYVQSEYTSLASEMDRVASTTEFNGTKLTDGSVATVDVQVGIRNTANDVITLNLADLTSATLGVDTGTLDMSTAAGAQTAIDAIDTALNSVNAYRADFGASSNRLDVAMNNLESFGQATQEAEGRIRDADFGQESANLASGQVLQQAGVAVLAQAKNINQQVTQLLN